MSIYEFDHAMHDETLREEGKAEGRAEGKAEGLAEGEAKGLAKGEVKGETKTLVKNIFTVLSLHGSIPENVKTAVMEETDLKRLDEMFQKALLLQSIDKFAEEFNLNEQ